MLYSPRLYPWDTQPKVTDAWIADAAFVDTSPITSWRPAKGIYPWTQATSTKRPTWTKTGGSKGHGLLNFDGTDDTMVNDAFVSKFANSTISFTLIIAAKCPSTQNSKYLLACNGSTSPSKDYFVFFLGTSNTISAETGDVTGSNVVRLNSTYAPGSSAFVVTYKYVYAPPPNIAYALRYNAVTNTANYSRGTIGTYTSQTLTKCTLGASRGGPSNSETGWLNYGLRGVVFAPYQLTDDECNPIEQFFIRQYT